MLEKRVSSGNWMTDLKKGLIIPHLSSIRKQTKREGQRWERIQELQTEDTFYVDHREIANALASVLRLPSPQGNLMIYAAYRHKFAKAAAEAGFTVIASDPSPHWAEFGRNLGLTSICSGVEDLPQMDNTLAYASFEPYPISCVWAGLFCALKSLSETHKGIVIFYYPGKRIDAPQLGKIRQIKSSNDFKESAANVAPFYKIFSVYGSTQKMYVSQNFEIYHYPTNKRIARQTGLDLRIIQAMQDNSEISVNRFAQMLNTNTGEIQQAIGRLKRISQFYLSKDLLEMIDYFRHHGCENQCTYIYECFKNAQYVEIKK